MASLGIDTNDLPEPSGGGPVPAGDYVVQVTEADCVNDDKAQGRRVTMTLEIQEGEFTGWKIWERCDIDRVAQTKNGDRKIDAARLNSFLQAIGKGGYVEDTDELIGATCVVRVKVREYTGSDGSHKQANNCQSYRPYATQETVSPRQQQTAPPPKPAAPAQRPATPQSRPAPAAPAGNRPAPAFMSRKAG